MIPDADNADPNKKKTELTSKQIQDLQQEIQRLKTKLAKYESENEGIKFLINRSPLPVFILDRNGILTDANNLLLERLQTTRNTLIGKYNILKDKNLEEQNQLSVVKEVLEEVKPAKITIVWEAHKSGVKNLTSINAIWIEAYFYPIKDDQGDLVNVICQWVDLTNQKKAETAHKADQKIFYDLFNSLNSGVAVYDVIDGGKDFVFKYFNDSAERIDKQKREELIGKSIFEVRPNLEAFGLINTFHKVLKTKQPQNHPVSIYKDVRLSGYYENYIFLLQTGELVAVFDDVTERVKFENDLKEAKEKVEENDFRLKFAIESGRLGIWDRDIQNNILVWNQRMYELYGVNEKDFSGKLDSWVKTLHPDDRQKAIDENNAALLSDKPFNTTFRVIHPGGKIVYIKADGFVIRDENNKPLRMIGINRDVTELVTYQNELIKAKERAEKSERRYKKAQAIGHVGSWEYDVKNAIFWGSDEAKRIYNLSLDKTHFLANEVMSRASGKDRERLDRALSDLLEKDKPYDVVYTITPLNTNEKKVIHSIAEVQRDQDNNPVNVIGVLQDITAQKRIEEELIKAKEKAEESDKLKSSFLANMSHEIRTPMNGILGFTSLLQEPGVDGTDMAKYISIIQKSGERMLKTVNDIIEISKIETEQVSLHYSNVNICKHLMTLKEFYSLDLEKKNLDLIIENELVEEETIVETDKTKLSSVISNLLKNAIKFTPKGSITIGCKANDGNLIIHVKDTGIGIPEKRRAAIFNRFEQADIGVSRAYEGAGLGLSIAKSYVEMMGGEIWVESEVNVGSTFYVSIPQYKQASDSPKTTIISDHAETHRTKNLKVLVAEDDEVSRVHINLMLKDFAREIKFAHNGVKAVNMAQEFSDLDLILMDIRMPEMDGLRATQKIREFNKNIVIIAQTAFAFEEDKQKALNAGCNDYISKPFLKKDLFALMNKFDKLNFADK